MGETFKILRKKPVISAEVAPLAHLLQRPWNTQIVIHAMALMRTCRLAFTATLAARALTPTESHFGH
jgi:hypothetical protein